MRKWIISSLTLILFFSVGVTGKAESHTEFLDVDPSFWAADEIYAMAQLGVINGYEDQTFRPQNHVTREEFATMLSKTFFLSSTSPETQTFSDVSPDRWSYGAIESVKDVIPAYASASGAPFFDPRRKAAREDVAAALVRTLGFTEDSKVEASLERYLDIKDISSDVFTDVAIAASRGLVNGYEDGTFRPKAAVTRAEAAVILYRALFSPVEHPPGNETSKQPSFPLITDFSQAVGWFGPVTHTVDPDLTIEGAASVHLATDEENTTTAARLQDLTLDLSQAKNLMIRLYVEDITNLSKFEVRLSSASNMASYLKYSHTRWQLVQGWNEIVIPMEKFTSVEGESFEDVMTTLQVSITQRGELPANVVFDALYRDYEGRGKVILQFDDGWASVYTKAFPMMREKGFAGNIGVISNFVGKNNYATRDQLTEMYVDGWDMFNHTANHPRLTTLSVEQVEDELRSAKAYLLRNRWTRAADYIAYPYGDFNDTVVNIAGQYSRFARSITPEFELDAPINPHRLKAIELVNDIEPAVYQEAIRSAASHGTTVIFFLHRIEDTGSDSIILHTEDFQAFLDFLEIYRDEIDIMSISEWYKTAQ